MLSSTCASVGVRSPDAGVASRSVELQRLNVIERGDNGRSGPGRIMAKNDEQHDFPPLSSVDPVKDWKRWKRDLMAHLQAQTDESGTNPMEHLYDRDMGMRQP